MLLMVAPLLSPNVPDINSLKRSYNEKFTAMDKISDIPNMIKNATNADCIPSTNAPLFFFVHFISSSYVLHTFNRFLNPCIC